MCSCSKSRQVRLRSSTFFRCFHSHSTGLRSGVYGGSASRWILFPAWFRQERLHLGPPVDRRPVPDHQEPTSHHTKPDGRGTRRCATHGRNAVAPASTPCLWGVTPPMTDRWSRVCHSSRTGVSPRGASVLTTPTYRATLGGTLASRELGLGRSGSDRDLSLHCGLVTRVSGRTAFGADCPKRSLAREASTLSLATCLPGFPGVVWIPLGRLSTSPIPLLARVALWFHHRHRRAGCIHARRLRESIKAVAIA